MSICTNHCPENRLAVTTLRTPDARSAQRNIVLSAFNLVRLRSDVAVWQQLVSTPSGKAMIFLPTPHGQSRRNVMWRNVACLQVSNVWLYLICHCEEQAEACPVLLVATLEMLLYSTRQR